MTSKGRSHGRRAWGLLIASAAFLSSAATAAEPGPPPARPLAPLGTTPPAEAAPRFEFAFEARVTLAPATVLGETGLGHRQYIPITGGTVVGPKFNGEVIPGGWDYQMRYGGGCSTLTADYFWRAADGTVIHILNEGMNCPGGEAGQRGWLRPTFEAPKGPHEWMTKATFVASLELEPPATPPAPGTPPTLGAIRIKFYQVK